MIARAIGVVAAGLIAVAALAPGAAHASVASMKRSIENVTQGPLDVVLTPVVAAVTARDNVEAEIHSTGGKVMGGALTYFGLVLMDLHAGFFRTFAGAVELPFALGALAASPLTDWEPPPFFDVEKKTALVDRPSSVYNVKFGVQHVGTRE